jgi:hypothetical protein
MPATALVLYTHCPRHGRRIIIIRDSTPQVCQELPKQAHFFFAETPQELKSAPPPKRMNFEFVPSTDGLEANHKVLLGCFLGAVVSFVIILSTKMGRMPSWDAKSEISLIKWGTKFLRGCILVLFAAQLPLAVKALSATQPLGTTPVIDGLPRPLITLVAASFGFFANSHTSMRV